MQCRSAMQCHAMLTNWSCVQRTCGNREKRTPLILSEATAFVPNSSNPGLTVDPTKWCPGAKALVFDLAVPSGQCLLFNTKMYMHNNAQCTVNQTENCWGFYTKGFTQFRLMHTGSCLGESVFQQGFMDFVVKCHLKFHCRNIYINILYIYIYQ